MHSEASQRLLACFERQHPIMQGPMGGVSGPALVAAVANAGALGTLPIWALPAARVTSAIEATQALTESPFVVNLRADLDQRAHMDAALACGIRWFHLFWGDPAGAAPTLQAHGARLLVTVSDADTAARALDAGADCLIAQGVEAGGHVYSELPLQELLPLTLARAGPIPVLAAGGISTAVDAQRALAAGAAGVVLGTRFAASEESDAHDDYKQALLRAGADATARSTCFDDGWPDAPHRTLINPTLARWQAAGAPAPGARPDEDQAPMVSPSGRSIARYSVTPPARGMSGTVTDGAMYAGTGVARVTASLPAAAIVAELAN